MGLASALNTALSGLSAAETTIDVVGNNLANANTVGFKASEATFATQFLQTLALGSAPSADSGGTNPRQIGLGTTVAEITPNFNQGTIQISANPMDMSIQGDGFFIVQGESGEQLYTRNGIFKLNAENQIVSTTGNRVLGYGVNDDYELQTMLVPLEIPVGQELVAQATQNVFLEGVLSPVGDVADTAEIIQTGVLGNATYRAPETAADSRVSQAPNWQIQGTTATPQSTGGPPLAGADGTYQYRFVLADGAYGQPWATESDWNSTDLTVAVSATDDRIQLNDLPTDTNGFYSYLRIYRSAADGSDFYYVDEVDLSGGGPPFAYVDTTTDAALVDPSRQFDTTTLTGNYSYYVTFYEAGSTESRPSPVIGPRNIEDGRIQLSNLPAVAPGDTTGWTHRRIYRNTVADPNTFYLVAETNDTTSTDLSFTDNIDDATLEATGETLDFDGPRISESTELADVLRRDGSSYEHVFQEGTLQFTGRKGGRSLDTKEFQISDTTTVGDLIAFMEQALGIRKSSSDPSNPLNQNDNPGGSVQDGRITLVANDGEANAIDVGLSGMQLVQDNGTTRNVNMPFGSIQSAVGAGAMTDFIVYDSLGIPLQVRLTAVLDSRDSTSTTYRWFADSPDNDPLTGVDIGVGTGLITFDGAGNFISATEATVNIDRQNVPSASPLSFEIEFSQLSGLAADDNLLAVSRQDGSPPGVLTSFLVGEDGVIRGVFSNGISRTIGQVRLARFANPAGLEQRGENVYSEGVNSGLPVAGSPGQQGIGTIIAGAVELSNTDMGSNLIDLILASTMYRGNTRVISTAQQMLDELLALRR
jgi:flagellar hook protein FlgE